MDIFYSEVENTVEEVKKSQKTRLVGDMLIIAPVMLYLGAKKGQLNMAERGLLLAIATSTLIYNLIEFKKYK